MVDTSSWLSDFFGFSGKRVLVTGASRGIGRTLALGFAQAGADLLLTARERSSLDALAAEIRLLGRNVCCLACDQRDIAAIQCVFADVGPVDVLVNNAGTEDVRPALDIDEALWDKIIDTNLKGAFFTAQAVAKGMISRQSGVILNLASLTSFAGVPTAVPYTSSKTGILGMTRALAAEWGPAGIRVNAIAPGYFQTDLTNEFYKNPEWVAHMTAKVPMNRLGCLDDLVGAALFLGSKASAYISGQCLVVDGGTLAML